MKRKMEISELIFKIVAYVFLILFALMCLYPLIYVLAGTFSSADAVTNNIVILWPMVGETGSYSFGFSGSAFSLAFNYNRFWSSYANTLFVTAFGTVWCLVYSILGAYALSKKRLLGRHGFNFFLVFTMWFSAGIVPQYLNYKATGTVFASLVGGSDWSDIDLKWLIVIAMGMNATNIILLRNAFEGVPSEIEEAARIDGATELQVLMNVYIPMSKATIATVALFFGISRWNGYFWAYKVTNEAGQKYSWPVQVLIRDTIEKETNITGKYDGDATHQFTSQGQATSVLYAFILLGIIPILVIYPFIQKYFAKGVNMGGVKE
jgi:putative aldouronate transport system permease protein